VVKKRMRYRLECRSIYRGKEWTTFTREFLAESAEQARRKARSYVARHNIKSELETLVLIGLVRIDQKEKTTNIPF